MPAFHGQRKGMHLANIVLYVVPLHILFILAHALLSARKVHVLVMLTVDG